MALERSLDVRRGEIGTGDDPMGNASAIRLGLKPGGLLHGVATSDRGFDVDDPLDVVEAGLGQEVVGEITTRLDGAVVAEVRIGLGLRQQPVPAQRRM
jgi:hypothetical protein